MKSIHPGGMPAIPTPEGSQRRGDGTGGPGAVANQATAFHRILKTATR